MKSERNRPCPCGSGKKYKVCCARKHKRSHWVAVGTVAIFVMLAAWALAGVMRKSSEEPPEGKVWSAEHGHWHDIDGAGTADTDGSLPPMRPPPPGKVWSEAHGHWHDAQDPGALQPAGPPPPGKVWSEEHGHWHDAATDLGVGEAPAPLIPEAQFSDGS